MKPPFVDGRGINRPPYLNRARRCRRRLALVKAERRFLPGEAKKLQDSNALFTRSPHHVFVTHRQYRMRGKRFLPVFDNAAKGEIIIRQLGEVVRKQKACSEMRLV